MTLKEILQPAMKAKGLTVSGLRIALADEGVSVTGSAIRLWLANQGGMRDSVKQAVSRVLEIPKGELVDACVASKAARSAA